MEQYDDVLNHFLMDVFNAIRKTEELCLDESQPDLTLREMDLIEMVCRAECRDGNNLVTDLAITHEMTVDDFTVAVAGLEKKGYLEVRESDCTGQAVRILATARGRAANADHTVFHHELVEAILAGLTEDEMRVFLRALGTVSSFFRDKFKTPT